MSKYYQGIGRRKTATASVRLTKGKTKIEINNEPASEYFYEFKNAQKIILAPLVKVNQGENFSISVLLKGGGKKSQMIAIQLAVARALLEYDSRLRPVLKKEGFLTRDPRMKERKKPGLKRARRAAQWQKR